MRNRPVESRVKMAWLIGLLVLVLSPSAAAAAGDATAPAAIADLAFPSIGAPDLEFDEETGTLQGVPLVLTWTAPGDDGDEGQAWRYDVRLVRGRLDEVSWAWAEPMADPLDLPLPSPAGEIEVVAFLEFSGLAPGAHYEIGVKALDETGRAGALSNIVGFEAPGQSETFVETVPIGDLVLWAWGLKIPGPEVECRYENSTLYIGGHCRPFVPEEDPVPLNPAQYAEVPTVQGLVAQGVAPLEATYRYLRTRRAFLFEVSETGREQGRGAATELLASSDLVDSVLVLNQHGGYLFLSGEGRRAEFFWEQSAPGIPAFQFHSLSTSPERARAAVDWLYRQAEAATRGPLVAVFARSGMMDLFSRRDQNAFRQQIGHLERGGRLAKLPPGPFSEGPAREFLTTLRHYGDQAEH